MIRLAWYGGRGPWRPASERADLERDARVITAGAWIEEGGSAKPLG